MAALAVIDADPVATGVTGTLTLDAPEGNVIKDGTVAAAGLLELKETVKLAGALTDTVKVRF